MRDRETEKQKEEETIRLTLCVFMECAKIFYTEIRCRIQTFSIQSSIPHALHPIPHDKHLLSSFHRMWFDFFLFRWHSMKIDIHTCSTSKVFPSQFNRCVQIWSDSICERERTEIKKNCNLNQWHTTVFLALDIFENLTSVGSPHFVRDRERESLLGLQWTLCLCAQVWLHSDCRKSFDQQNTLCGIFWQLIIGRRAQQIRILNNAEQVVGLRTIILVYYLN